MFSKLILVLLSVFTFSTASFATYLPNFGSYFALEDAFYTSQDFSRLIFLVCGTSANTNCTFRKADAAAGYTVTAAKTLKCWGGSYTNPTSAASLQLKCTTNDVGWDSATALTSNTAGAGSSVGTPGTSGRFNTVISCGAGSYLSLAATQSTVSLACLEF